jgi:hypothetical protein
MKAAAQLATILFIAGCGQQLPRPECDPAESAGSPLTCDTAVQAAVQALPPNHPGITRIQFGYGTANPGFGRALARDQPVYGYVVFTWADGSRRQYVQLTEWQGKLTVESPAPY